MHFHQRRFESGKNDHLCSMHFKESVRLDLRLKGQDSLLLGCIYRSPSFDNHEGHFEKSNRIEKIPYANCW